MAELTDEEKAKAAFGDVETSKEEDETDDKDASQTDEGSEQNEADEQSEDKSEESETDDSTDSDDGEESDDDSKQSLTKPFPWLKGNSPDEWTKELATAYENSTNEALRLKKQLEDNNQIVEEAKKIVANSGASTDSKDDSQQSSGQAPNLEASPESQYAKTLMEQDMVKSFDTFAKEFPQAREPNAMKQIESVSQASAQVFLALNGRQPTYAELFGQIAKDLNWKPVKDTSKKDQAIKENAASASSPQSTSSRPPTKAPQVSEDQLKVARRIMPDKTDEEILKDLPNYVNS